MTVKYIGCPGCKEVCLPFVPKDKELKWQVRRCKCGHVQSVEFDNGGAVNMRHNHGKILSLNPTAFWLKVVIG